MASFDEVVLPGKVGKVTAKVETKEMRGAVDRGITLTTDDPDQPSVPLWIHLDVAGSVILLPRGNLDIRPGHPTLGEPAKLLVRQDPGEKGELRVTGATIDVPWLRVTTRRVEAPEPAAGELPEARPGDFLVEVAIAGEVPEGTERHTLRFATGLPTEATVEVPVLVFVRPRMQIVPDEVRFGPAEPDGFRRAVVQVSVRPDMGEAPPAIEGPEGLKFTVDPAGANRYQVHLSWPAQKGPAGTIVIRAGTASKVLPIVADPSAPAPPPAH